MSGSPFKGKSLCVITGASRGYGKCIAEMFVTRLVPGSHLLLLARNTELLVQVTAQLCSLNKEVQVTWSEFDQAKLSDCSPENIQSILKKACVNLGDFETLFLIHNAGSVGDLTKYSWEYTDANMLSSAVNTNLTGTFLLNASLLTEIRKHDYKHKVIVNISSLGALQPFASWSLYCAGKFYKTYFILNLF
jgi:sepiapterin reductase